MINSQNELREMLASGVVSPEDVQRLAMQAPGDPQENSRIVQNALAEVFSSQLPTGSMRNQSTGKMTYFRPSPGPGPGFSNTPYTQEQAAYGGGQVQPQAPQAQRRGVKVYGVGNGQIIELGEDEEKTLPVDYTRAPITIPGVGKAHYTADGRFAVGTGSDGQPFKAILGYDAAGSAQRNAQALAQEKTRADIAQTNQQIAASQQQVAASQQSAGLAQAAEARAAEEHAAKMTRREVKPSTGEDAVDREFAKEYVSFKASGGFADVQKQLWQLKDVSTALGTDDTLTGPIRGQLPDKIRAVTHPEAIAAKEAVEEVAQRNLRLVLGAQFTEKEGERLIARTFNPALSAAENKRRVDRLIKQIETAAKVKQAAADYFETNGTLRGWGGKLPSWSDFGSDSDTPAVTVPKVGEVRNGYKFLGGNPSDKSRWLKVR